MGQLQQICREYVGRFVVAYDWAGSSSADPRDNVYFNLIFGTRRASGKTLFEEWVSEPSTERKEPLIDEVEEILNETRWLASYKGSIKAQVRDVFQAGAKVSP